MTLPEPIANALSALKLTPHKAGAGAAWEATVALPGTAAFGAWKQLAEACRGQGYWPVILGEDKQVAAWSDTAKQRTASPAAKTIAAADSVNLDAFLLRDEIDPEEAPDTEPGDWPDDEDVGRQTVPATIANNDGKPHARVTIGFFRVEHSYEVFAHLAFGDWNDCPSPSAHVARHRDWNRRFGSEVCAVTFDTVECFVARPPTSRDDALMLAREQYFYCYDIVEQGTESIAALAAALVEGSLWFFWWD